MHCAGKALKCLTLVVELLISFSADQESHMCNFTAGYGNGESFNLDTMPPDLSQVESELIPLMY